MGFAALVGHDDIDFNEVDAGLERGLWRGLLRQEKRTALRQRASACCTGMSKEHEGSLSSAAGDQTCQTLSRNQP